MIRKSMASGNEYANRQCLHSEIEAMRRAREIAKREEISIEGALLVLLVSRLDQGEFKIREQTGY